MTKTVRKDPCPCGSGKKYKNCCNAKVATLTLVPTQDEFSHLTSLFNAGRYAELESRAFFLLKQYPDSGFTWQLLGASLKKQGKDALYAFQKSAKLLPNDAGAHSNLGVALRNVGQLNEAVESYLKAIQIQPDFADAYFNLGNVLKELGRFEDAAGSYRRTLELKPNYANAHYNLGNVLKELWQFGDAEKSYRRVLELQPGFSEAHFYLGVVLHNTGQLEEAIACYRRALEINPELAEAHSNLGACLKELGQVDDAVTSCFRALQINPDNAMAHNNLGNAFKEAGRLDEAIDCYRSAVAVDPHYTQAYSNLVYMLTFHPLFDEQSILAEAKRFASTIPLYGPLSASLSAEPENNFGRRLRIGYISPDFRDHCQSLFTIPLLSNHDHVQFEIYCYAQLARPDEISKRLATYADVWRSTNGKTDAQLAEMIASDGIDILIDLTMHMGNGRPLVFARKPAPVQVAWLAYPGTTGIAAIDYRLTDPWLDPPLLGDDRYSERSIRLPDTFWCYDSLISGLQPNALPAQTAGYVTFGCLNNFCKVSDDTLCRWGQVMARLPSSRLILMASAGLHRQRVFDILGRYGVDAEHIEFVEFQPRFNYLQTYHRIDLCLDTLPYNGHTTSLDAYWMGVPVITQVGHTVVGRAGWSQLNNLGLSEFAAFDDQAFADIAVALATDLLRLSELRQTLRGRLEVSPLMDGKRFAGAIETVYRNIWLKNCQEKIEARSDASNVNHRNLTVVAINGNGDGSEMLPSLSHSVNQLKGARGLLLSLKKPHRLSDGIEWVKIDQAFDRTGYSFFVIYFLHHYISTSHVLIVQHDGWVLNGENFKPYFYDYDYIGVTSHAANVGDSFCEGYTWVGRSDTSPVYCGGFSLRTKRFLEAPSLYKITPQNITRPLFVNEDIQLCVYMRPQLEDRGFKFAPMDISREFGFEYLGKNLNDNDDLRYCLGQHGNTRVLTGENQVLFKIPREDINTIYGERKVLELFQLYGYEIKFLNHLS